jgi:hypothetical protein
LSTADGRTGAGPFTYEMGVKVKVDLAMQLTSIRYYKSPGETGTHVGRVWTSGGVQLAQVTFTGETASGWQVQALATPLSLAANDLRRLGEPERVLRGDAERSRDAGGLRAAAQHRRRRQRRLRLRCRTFPASSFSSSNYFVDVIVDTPTTPTAPTVTATSPTSSATGIAPNTQVTATLSRAMDAATLTSSTFTLTGPSGAVAGTVVRQLDERRHAHAVGGPGVQHRLHGSARFVGPPRTAPHSAAPSRGASRPRPPYRRR